MNLDAIRARIVTMVDEVSAVAKVYDYDPDSIPSSPTAAVLYEGFDNAEDSMGGSYAVVHHFVIRLYFALTSTERAEDSLIATLPAVVAAFADEGTLNSTCRNAKITGSGDKAIRADMATPAMHIDVRLDAEETYS